MYPQPGILLDLPVVLIKIRYDGFTRALHDSRRYTIVPAVFIHRTNFIATRDTSPNFSPVTWFKRAADLKDVRLYVRCTCPH